MTQKATSPTTFSVPRQSAQKAPAPTAQPSNAERLNALLNPPAESRTVGVDQSYLDECIGKGAKNFEDTFGSSGGLLHDLVGSTISADRIEESLASAAVGGLGELGDVGGEFEASQKSQLIKDLQQKAGDAVRAGQYGDRIACGISKHPGTMIPGLAGFILSDSKIDISRDRKLSETLTAKGGVNLGSTLDPRFAGANAGLNYANTWESESGNAESTQAQVAGEYNKDQNSWKVDGSGSIVRDWGTATLSGSHSQTATERQTQANGSINYKDDEQSASLVGSFGLLNGDTNASLRSSYSNGENTYGLTGTYQDNAAGRTTKVGASHSHRSDDLTYNLSGHHQDANGAQSAGLQGSFQSGTGVGADGAETPKTSLSGSGSVNWSETAWNAKGELSHTQPVDGGWQRTLSAGFGVGSAANSLEGEYALERENLMLNLKAASDFNETTLTGGLKAKDGDWDYSVNGSQSTSGDASIGGEVSYNPTEDLSLSAEASLKKLNGKTAAEMGVKGALKF